MRALRRAIVAAIVMIWLLTSMLAAPGSAHKAAQHQHEQWAKHTVLEQFGVTATEVYIRMQYYQNTTDVWGARYDDGYCYHSAFPGWTINSCTYWLTSTSTHQQIDITGTFHNSLGIDYKQHAWTQAWDDNSQVRRCYFDWGSLPPLWSTDCQGGRNTV